MTKAESIKMEESKLFQQLSKGAKKLQSHLNGMATKKVVMRNSEVMQLLKIGSKNTLAKYWRELLDTGWITRNKITPSMGYAKNEIGLYLYTIQFVIEKQTSSETDESQTQPTALSMPIEVDTSTVQMKSAEEDGMDNGHVVEQNKSSIFVEEKEDAHKQEHKQKVVFVKKQEPVTMNIFEASKNHESGSLSAISNVQLENVSMYSLNDKGEWEANQNLYANDLEEGQTPVFKIADFEGMAIKYFVNKWGRRTPVIDYYFNDDAKTSRYLEFLNIKDSELPQQTSIVNTPAQQYPTKQLKEQSLFDIESKQNENQHTPRTKIIFGYDSDNRFHNITQDKINEWQTKYNLVNIVAELSKMESWLANNQFDRRSDICKFIVKWLKKSQEKASYHIAQQGASSQFQQNPNIQIIDEYPQMNDKGFQDVVNAAKELGKIFSIDDAKAFIGYYSATNWTRGNTRISNWKSLLLAWRIDPKTQGMTQLRRGMKVDSQGKIYDELGNDVHDYTWI